MKFFKEFRKQEVLVLLYRIFLAYVFYQIARLLFWYFNKELIKVDSVSDYFNLAFHGTAFDTTAILYVNALFILLSLVPVVINTKKGYQNILFWLYFITNGIAYAMNFGDFIYYKFSQARLTSTALDVAKHESNVFKVFTVSLGQHPFVLIWFVVLMALWVFLYKRIKITEQKPLKLVPYFIWSVIVLCGTIVLVIGGIRGDFKHSTRPINLVDANRFVVNPLQGNIVLNSTFSFFRTLGTNNFKEVHFVDEKYITDNVQPYKIYDRKVENRPNIVIFIVESFGREYSGAFNKDKNIKGYVSYTPFIDSLAGQSLIFPNTFANGRQSIHGMSSVLAGIPSLTDAFTSSPYSNQKIQSIVSVCNDLGYDTSFYHGAPNGSMGFLGFGNILGFKHYFGKNEYNHDEDFDGMWAIWDEPFLQYFAKNVGKKQPFMATVFTASSHHPFKIPEKYNGKFKKGTIEMHEPIQYTDYAIKKYFETAKKQPWFNNTIFVFTGDHTNQVAYGEYEKAMNRFAVPLILYSPNPDYHLQGVNPETAQQIDIYPTLADLIGYNKPIRSWGRSVVSDKKYPSVIVNSDGSSEQFIIGNYMYRFDGKEITGVYDKNDLGFENNQIGKLKTPEIEKGMLTAKAWFQDYMDRVINRKLK
ncbi:alkaline phosphatase family protein [Chryseobacterium carnipullorum]|uniref:Alkaline phosphatase family protein n=1 Tax=Chryseobacterium carnipullorum TaxID=1124835 RepID=A0A376DQR9_CHRCU|nr:alkaline phosphatase family protein [Chryseobacterium carnipullorum]AZA48728.1 alkaline phosphatase family protein [Chryseobacterium carnipullorum]AZA63641.1 alkaline phosphatase family protein [Chryseobacterium carnipullorum]STC93026.1 Lipoteichoic acid synthase 1 [Chryseobacterium carnipullorum]